MTTPHATGSPAAVSFYASPEFIAALDRAAAEQGETRSHHARKALACLLRGAGKLDHDAPVTIHEARRKAYTENKL